MDAKQMPEQTAPQKVNPMVAVMNRFNRMKNQQEYDYENRAGRRARGERKNKYSDIRWVNGRWTIVDAHLKHAN